MHALVTGGAGFIGSHLVDRLLSEGHSVTVVDSFDRFYPRTDKEANIASHRRNPQWALVEADIADLPALRAGLGGGYYDVVVHLAARVGVRPSIQDPLGYTATNIIGTQNLLELAREWGVRQFVFASSSSVYGVNPRVPWSEEDHVLLPISPYASTKVSGELLGHVYSHLHDIRFVALRFLRFAAPVNARILRSTSSRGAFWRANRSRCSGTEAPGGTTRTWTTLWTGSAPRWSTAKTPTRWLTWETITRSASLR